MPTAPNTTEVLLNQELITSLYDNPAEASRMAHSIFHLAKLCRMSNDIPELACLKDEAEGDMTVEKFLRLMAMEQMAVEHQPLLMKRLDRRWDKPRQRSWHDLADRLQKHLGIEEEED